MRFPAFSRARVSISLALDADSDAAAAIIAMDGGGGWSGLSNQVHHPLVSLGECGKDMWVVLYMCGRSPHNDERTKTGPRERDSFRSGENKMADGLSRDWKGCKDVSYPSTQN